MANALSGLAQALLGGIQAGAGAAAQTGFQKQAEQRKLDTQIAGEKRAATAATELAKTKAKTEAEKLASQQTFEAEEAEKQRKFEAAESEKERVAKAAIPKPLSAGLTKNVTDAISKAETAEINVSKYNSLANEIEATDLSGGAYGIVSEKVKGFFGEQDNVTALRTRFNEIKATAVMNNLPPGSASDRDVQFAMSGFPKDTATSEQMASFLRGMAKLERVKADYNAFKANYIEENRSQGGLIKAWKDQFDGEFLPKSEVIKQAKKATEEVRKVQPRTAFQTRLDAETTPQGDIIIPGKGVAPAAGQKNYSKLWGGGS